MINYTERMSFPQVGRKEVEVDFDGGNLTSDGGLSLLSDADRVAGVTASMARAIDDCRQGSKIRHSVLEMLRSRVHAIASGYEDANDLDTLRDDPALKLASGRCPLSGDSLASQPTVSRFENSVSRDELRRVGRALAERVIAELPAETQSVILDIDASDDPCHGQQELEGFNGYYDSHCYLPLFLHLTDDQGHQWPLAALLRPGRTKPIAGVRTLLRHAVRMLRQRWPDIEILVRADGGFGCEQVFRYCDALQVQYVIGMPTNNCLKALGQATQDACQAAYDTICAAATCAAATAMGNELTNKAPSDKVEVCLDGCVRYGEFLYKAGSWPYHRNTIIKVSFTRDNANRDKINPRYVVSNVKEWAGRVLDACGVYELYCGRGDQENRIKELKLDLNSGRTSCHRFWANQMRLLEHLAANILWTVIRVMAKGTIWAKAQICTMQLQIVKVAARVRETTRRVWLNLCTSYPYQLDWRLLQQRLAARDAATPKMPDPS